MAEEEEGEKGGGVERGYFALARVVGPVVVAQEMLAVVLVAKTLLATTSWH